MYDVLKFLHIVAAIVWVGAGFWTGFFGARVAASKDPARAQAFAADMAIGSRIITSSAALVLVFGAWMVVTEDAWTWEQAWIVIGVVAVVIGGFLGGMFFAPNTTKALKAFEEGRIPDAIATMRKIGLGSRAMTVLLLVVVFAMVAKWGA